MMRWPWQVRMREDPVDWRAEAAGLGDTVYALRQQLAEAVQRATQAERASQQLETANEGLRIELGREKAGRLDAQARQAAAEKAAQELGGRVSIARTILSGDRLSYADANAQALQVLKGESGG